MDFEVSFAGVVFPLDTPKVREALAQNVPLDDLVDGMHFLPPLSPNPSYRLQGVAYPKWPARRLRLGDFFYPSGASRWACYCGIADEETADQLRAAAFPATASGQVSAGTFKIRCDAEGDVLASTGIETQMLLLPPRPLQVLDSSFEGLYLIQLVDERWRFQWSDAGDIEPDDSAVTWASLLTTVASALGITLTQGSISSTYGLPAQDSPLFSHNESAASVLDALAWNVGKLVVRNYDGTYKLQTPDEAKTAVDGNLPNPRDRVSGGDAFTVLPSDNAGFSRAMASVLPQTVKVVFPKFVLSTGYVDTRPQWHHTKQSWGDTYTKSVGVGDSGLSMAGSFVGTKVFHDTARAVFAASGDPTPSNQTALDALATQIARDYLEAQAHGIDEVYAGVRAWTPEGLDDILVRYHIDDGPMEDGVLTAVPRCYTRIMRKPWNFMVRDFQHEIGTSTGTVNMPVTTPVTYSGSPPLTITPPTNQPHVVLDHKHLQTTLPGLNQTYMTRTPAGLRMVTQMPDGTYRYCCIPCQPLNNDLATTMICWLQFEETSGTAYDASGNGLDFTESGASVDVAGKVVHSENLGARQLVRASSNYFTRAYSSDWAIGASGFSISVWVYLDSLTDDMYIISKAAGGGTAWSLRVDNAGNVRFTFGGQTTPTNAAVVVGTGAWHQIHARYDTSDSKIRVSVNDGTSIASAAGASHTDGSATIYVGQDGSNDNYWDGRLDELIVAKTSSDAATRSNIYSDGNGTPEPDCYPLPISAIAKCEYDTLPTLASPSYVLGVDSDGCLGKVEVGTC